MMNRFCKYGLICMLSAGLLAGCGSTADSGSQSSTTSAAASSEVSEEEASASATEETSSLSEASETAEATASSDTEELLGWQVQEGDNFTDANAINFMEVTFPEMDVCVGLPTAVWDPENFKNMSEDGGGEDSESYPLTDWTTEDGFVLITPNTAFFSLTKEDSTITAEDAAAMSDEDFISWRLNGYSNMKSVSDEVIRTEQDGGYQAAIKISMTVELYSREFSFQGYWISVFTDDGIIDVSYAEALDEDGNTYGYDTDETFLEHFTYLG